MKERYENWKELKPLTAHVPIGTKCVSLIEEYGVSCGEIIEVVGRSGNRNEYLVCRVSACDIEMREHELALLPSEEPAKVERKIVQIALTDSRTEALCDDGTVWRYYELSWKLLPPIPQDAV